MEKEVKFKKYHFREYNKDYPKQFQQEKIKLIRILGKSVNIKHVGSTAVPKLGGKGIIDIAILVKKEEFKRVFELLKKQRYEYCPYRGENKRLFLQRYYPNKINPKKIIHIHLTFDSKGEFNSLIAFRDYLLKHPEEAKKYADIKKKASLNCKGVKERYWKIKGEILNSILKKSLKSLK